MSMNVTLNNGVEMPALGFGVFQTPPGVTAASVAEVPRRRCLQAKMYWYRHRSAMPRRSGQEVGRAGQG
jgi:hypothetical protein